MKQSKEESLRSPYVNKDVSNRLSEEITDYIKSQITKASDKQESNIDDIIQQSIDHFGLEHQIGKAIEELGELITELSRWLQKDKRANLNNIAEETADVQIICKYIEQLTGKDNIAKWKKYKLERLKNTLNDPPTMPENNK